jgi:hypothetical protein
MVLIHEDLSQTEEDKMLSYLNLNKDVFAWSTLDLVGTSHDAIKYSLRIDPSIWLKKAETLQNVR